MYYFFIFIFSLFPRLFILFLKILTDWFEPVSRGWLWIALGIIFAPLTFLWYSIIINWFFGVWQVWQIAIFVFAIILDLFVWHVFRRHLD